MRLTLLARWLPALLAVALASPARADEWNRTYKVSDHPSMRIETNDGRVTVTPWDRPEIAIHVTTNGWHIGPHTTVDAEQNGSEVVLNVHRSTNGLFIGWDSRWIHIEVSMPRKADLSVHTGDGGVNVESLEGLLRIWTGDGHIDVHALRGDINLHTGDGGIEARELDGRLVASSGDGRISVNGRFDSLDLSSGDGTIEAEAQKGSAITSPWSVHTGDGGVTLRIPEDLKADLEASTGDGHISVELPVQVTGTWRPSRELRGTLNGGGPPLRLRSGDGSIRIEKL